MNHQVICKKVNFNLEEEIKEIFRNNLSNIFLEVTFVDDEYVPFHAKESRIDHVLLHSKNNKFVLIEYKKRQGRDPINQILNYRRLLAQERANFYVFKDLFFKTTKIPSARTIWGKFTEDWWRNNLILVCIAPANFFSKDQIGVSEENNIILIETQKYDENIYNIVFLKKENKNLLGSKFQSIIMKDLSIEELGKTIRKEKLGVINVNEKKEKENKVGEDNSFEKTKKWAKEQAEKVINLNTNNFTYDQRINRYDIWDKKKKKIILTIYFYDMRHRKILPKIFLVNPSQNLKEQYKNKLAFKTKWKSDNGDLDESYQYVINDNFKEAHELLLEFVKGSKNK